MRILHVSTRLILGGSQENTVLSCEGQASLGHDVHLAFGPIYGPEGSMLERVGAFRTTDGRGITTHVVPDMIREIHPLRDRRCLKQLRALVRGLDPDVVHTHSSKAGVLGRMAGWLEGGRAGRRAIVHTIHGPPFHRYLPEWKNRMYVMAERLAARRCHAIASVADAMTRQFLDESIGRPGLYETVRSGMDTSVFLDPAPGATRGEVRARLGLEPDAFVIGTVARLAELKGHDDLLDALGDDLRANPSWRLLWVGDGWWRERLERRVEEMGLEDRVVLTGLVPPDEIPGLMRAMDVLAHPSYREGLPRTVPQALLAGTAAIAYAVDGAPEVIEDGVTGRLVEAGDTVGLREAVAWMAEDPDRRAATARAGRERCRDEFSAEHMVRALESLYMRTLERIRG
jgi:glycosyltransferase involved in cell wall biosynthesis